MYNDNLYHYGIKGMRWGVRRTPAQLGHAPKSKTHRFETKSAKVKRQNKEAMSRMSDTELRERINRLNMEKQYMELTTPKKNAGKKFASELLSNSTKSIASSLISEYGKKYVKSMIDEIIKNTKK